MEGKFSRTGIFFQDACLQHQYIRSQDLSAVVERPERLRAVSIGVSAAIARLEERFGSNIVNWPGGITVQAKSNENELELAMSRLKLGGNKESRPLPISLIQSNATLDLLNHPAVKYVHGDSEGDKYLDSLKRWTKESWDKIQAGDSEIPMQFSQGDLYLCPESIIAIQGALGIVCEAVDAVIMSSKGKDKGSAEPPVESSINHAFVSTRPPGHHCKKDTPSGFCFVNNVAVGAAHAYLNYGITRVVIFDIDLHHGNGTQSIAWQINEKTYQQTLEKKRLPASSKPGLQLYYGSVHDVLSYPCEDGNPEFIQAASISIHQAHGQHIENVHMESYDTDSYFWDVLYKKQYGHILDKAKMFLDRTGGPGDDVLIFISCGMDACEHEYASMSRHNRKVPTSLYYRFTCDVGDLAERYARGRIVSVLEGGYSERALISGTIAHICGLVDKEIANGIEEWWSVDNLTKLEKVTKKRRGGRPSLSAPPLEPWLERTLKIFRVLDPSANVPARTRSPPPPLSNMTLRGRKDKTMNLESLVKSTSMNGKNKQKSRATSKQYSGGSSSNEESELLPSENRDGAGNRKLPRVILKLGSDPATVPRS